MNAARERPLAIWGRRVASISLYALLATLLAILLPVLLPVAALIDRMRGRDLAIARCLLFFALYLACELTGVGASFALWLTRGPWTGRDEASYLAAAFRLQQWWARTLYRGAERIFGMRTEVQGEDAVRTGPFLLLLRHASVGDTLLPAVYISGRYGIVLRYVLKRELLWDPCLDIVGNRLPNYFVRRGSGESGREIEAMCRLMDDLGPRDGVLLYPEGTRFTPEKRAAILERLRKAADADAYERAAALRHVLPPRLGGALGLLEKSPRVDVVFCAHTGFEGAGKFEDLLAGSLVHQRIRIRFWRVPFTDIPTDAEGRAAWIHENWRRIDEWLEAERRGEALERRRSEASAQAGGSGARAIGKAR